MKQQKERLKFSRIGDSEHYDFDYGDLNISRFER